jgi:hypothetical protein
MGTDWRFRDDALEPVTEIYQGDRISSEAEGAPRAATRAVHGPGGAGEMPAQKGLIWNALGAGYKMGFIASSDHDSTHISYANLIVPDKITTRQDIQQALLERRTYASTDNIVVDFYAGGTMQGGDMAADGSPMFQVKVAGTEPVREINIIKNNRIIFTRRTDAAAADPRRVAFTFRDTQQFGGDFADTSMAPTSEIASWSHPETGIRRRPEGKYSYYYVRVIQSYNAERPDLDGEIAWSSPIFVRQK